MQHINFDVSGFTCQILKEGQTVYLEVRTGRDMTKAPQRLEISDWAVDEIKGEKGSTQNEVRIVLRAIRASVGKPLEGP